MIYVRIVYGDVSCLLDVVMSIEDPWSDRAKRLLRAEMIRRGTSYEDLARGLEGIGVRETVPNLRNKVSRGRFTAAFLLQCLHVLGCHELRTD